jgi:hypothetical protein
MNLWYERLELAEEQEKDMQRDAQNQALLRQALKGKISHPGAQLFRQINQIAKQIRTDEDSVVSEG